MNENVGCTSGEEPAMLWAGNFLAACTVSLQARVLALGSRDAVQEEEHVEHHGIYSYTVVVSHQVQLHRLAFADIMPVALQEEQYPTGPSLVVQGAASGASYENSSVPGRAIPGSVLWMRHLLLVGELAGELRGLTAGSLTAGSLTAGLLTAGSLTAGSLTAG